MLIRFVKINFLMTKTEIKNPGNIECSAGSCIASESVSDDEFTLSGNLNRRTSQRKSKFWQLILNKREKNEYVEIENRMLTKHPRCTPKDHHKA